MDSIRFPTCWFAMPFIVPLLIGICFLLVLIVGLLLQIYHEIQAIRLEILLRKKKYYEAAKYAFSKRFLCTEEFNTEMLDSSTIKTFYETLYNYAKLKCGTDGIMTVLDVKSAIWYLFEEDEEEFESQIINIVNNSNLIAFHSNKSHFWYSSCLTSGLLLLFLVENGTITLTKEIPFEKIITGKFGKDEILDVIDETH